MLRPGGKSNRQPDSGRKSVLEGGDVLFVVALTLPASQGATPEEVADALLEALGPLAAPAGDEPPGGASDGAYGALAGAAALN
jgi:hypothetical protein